MVVLHGHHLGTCRQQVALGDRESRLALGFSWHLGALCPARSPGPNWAATGSECVTRASGHMLPLWWQTLTLNCYFGYRVSSHSQARKPSCD